MLLIGSHVSFDKDNQIYGSFMEAMSYGETTFMFYTGAPQNTRRSKINKDKVLMVKKEMEEKGLPFDKIIVHAPYIINLANNKDSDKYKFAISFLKQEIKRCEELEVKYLVLHPGSHVGCGIDEGIKNIANALNEVLVDSSVTILLETMAGKGTEVGSSFEEIASIISLLTDKTHIGVCMDTCHMNDAGYDLEDFDKLLDDFDKIVGIKYLHCIHINDSKNEKGAHKDRHENIGFGYIGFDRLIKIIYNDRLKDIPKILETPYIDRLYPPYKEEIEMIRNKKFDKNLKEKLTKE